MAKLSFIVIATAAAFAAPPAFAQFGPIFNDGPPRPPADIPQRQQQQQQQQQQFPNRNFPTNNDRFPSNDGRMRPPGDIRSDAPPEQPLPAPMSLPPSNRPGGGSIQSTPLPALPGTAGPPETGTLTP
ncbi:MAG: hypothetical protein WBD48_19125, partial [Pseudolabrys sp.]